MSGGIPAKPAIPSTPTSAAFWQGLAQGQLLLSRCDRCGHHHHYPRELCPVCWSPDLTAVAASGRGTVWSMTTVHRAGHPAWQAETPYVVALVRLEEGPVLMTNVLDGEPDGVAVDAEVEAEFRHDAGSTLVVFRLSASRDGDAPG